MSIFRVSYRVAISHNKTLKNNLCSIQNGFQLQQNELLLSRYMPLTTNKACITTSFQFPQENCIQLYQNLQSQKQQQQPLKNYCTQKNMNNNESQRVVAHQITKNLTLVSNLQENVTLVGKKMKLKEPIDKPLVVMFSWMLARKKHLLKCAKIYTDQSFNVLIIELTPWQLLWPTKGSQLVAADALNFLENNTKFSPLIIHGFSVGGYLWGEMMALMTRDLPRYQILLDRFFCQIWDSAADITEIPIGVPNAIFPNNKTLQNALRNYVLYHMKTFHDVATVHYLRSSQLFHFTLLKVPALFLVSKTDPIGAVGSNNSVKEDMESAGIKTVWKCWDKSPHVCHFQHHPEEYTSLVFKHLEESNVFGRIAEKARAKL